MPNRPKNIKKLAFFTAFSLLFFYLSGCAAPFGPEMEKHTRQGFFLNTVIELTVYGPEGEDMIDKCFEKCAGYERIFSRTDPDSELYKLSAAGGGPVSPELETVLCRALDFCRLSGGRFDVTMGGVSELYGFSQPEHSVPTDAELAAALEHTGWEKLSLENGLLTMGDPQAVIDLGAIAKGYIADALRDYLVSRGVESATINLGGNVLCLGSKPDGSPFSIGIRRPENGSSELITALSVSEKSVVTSGVYERCFELDGVTYHHLLDPDSGRPIENGLASVTVVTASSMDADALSTCLFSLGLEEGLELADSLEGVWAMFITDDMRPHYSEGFEENFIK